MNGRPRRRRRRWFSRSQPNRNDDYIWLYQFPQHVEDRCRQHHPDLSDHDWQLIEQGLREWFLCCAWRDGEVLGMPSKLVDEAWHEFILDSRHYTEFCERAFGEYLHHTPESSMTTPMTGALDATNRAWDRTGMDSSSAVLWSLDGLIGHGAMGSDGGHHHHEPGGEAGGSFEASEASGAETGSGSETGVGEPAGSDSGGRDSGGSDSGGGDSGGGDSGGSSCGGGSAAAGEGNRPPQSRVNVTVVSRVGRDPALGSGDGGRGEGRDRHRRGWRHRWGDRARVRGGGRQGRGRRPER